MKVCFPVEDDRGLDSLVCDHFGQAPAFLLVDTESMEVTSVQGEPRGHQHGQCSPVALLGNVPVDVLVVGGIGGGAIMKMQARGIGVFKAAQGTVRENLELVRTGRLLPLSPEMVCHGHGNAGGCGH